MKISIITPSYNSEKYIEDCIKSVQLQNYHNYEHVIVDGGSTDGTLNIIKKYPHLRWISEKDNGQSDALNKGLSMVTGEIIGWLNSDDVYTEGTFGKVAGILADPSIDGVYSNCYFADDKLTITRKLISHRPIKTLSIFYCFIPSTTFFFKRKIVDAGIRFDVNLDLTMDKNLFADILYSGFTLMYSKDYYAKFRWHSSNKSINSPAVRAKRYKEGLKIYNRHSRIKLPDTNAGVYIYIIIVNVLRIYKNILRIADRI